MKIIMLFAIAATTTLFASCDSGNDNWYNDNNNNQNTNNNISDNTLNVLANTLRGHWEGKMIYEYTENGIRKQAAFDAQMEFDNMMLRQLVEEVLKMTCRVLKVKN
jgi:ribosome-associated toxin RatA of RatAB toxin-antitoxin module